MIRGGRRGSFTGIHSAATRSSAFYGLSFCAGHVYSRDSDSSVASTSWQASSSTFGLKQYKSKRTTMISLGSNTNWRAGPMNTISLNGIAYIISFFSYSTIQYLSYCQLLFIPAMLSTRVDVNIDMKPKSRHEGDGKKYCKTSKQLQSQSWGSAFLRGSLL